VSDLLAMWKPAEGPPQLLASDQIPAAATGLAVGLELYPLSAAAGSATVRIAVMLEGESDPVVEQELVPEAIGDGAWRAVAQLPDTVLLLSAYTVRATILDASGNTLGSQSRTIRSAAGRTPVP
jgi:hypothetical protein